MWRRWLRIKKDEESCKTLRSDPHSIYRSYGAILLTVHGKISTRCLSSIINNTSGQGHGQAEIGKRIIGELAKKTKSGKEIRSDRYLHSQFTAAGVPRTSELVVLR